MEESISAVTEATPRIVPRRPWLAVVLSLLFGSIGQIYAGCFRRGMLFWVVGTLLQSNDSRSFGPVPLADLDGRARLIFWSQDYSFPNPYDSTTGIPGRIRWDRIGKRLD